MKKPVMPKFPLPFKQQGADNPAQVSIVAALANLDSTSADHGVVISGLLNFVQDAEDAWIEWNQRYPADRDPATDLQCFTVQKLKLHLEQLSDQRAVVILWRLQNDFGHRIRSLLDAAIAQVQRREGMERLVLARTLLQEMIDVLGQRLSAGPAGFLSQARYDPNERVAVELAMLRAWGL